MKYYRGYYLHCAEHLKVLVPDLDVGLCSSTMTFVDLVLVVGLCFSTTFDVLVPDLVVGLCFSSVMMIVLVPDLVVGLCFSSAMAFVVLVQVPFVELCSSSVTMIVLVPDMGLVVELCSS